MTPELSRLLAVGRVGDGTRFTVDADAAEREAVARRMGLLGLPKLTCRFELRRDGDTIVHARGALSARVVQTCVVTLEPFEAELAEDFVVRFVPAGSESDVLDIDAEDEIPYAGGTIDLGEATSEQLALALDPFPRKPGADFNDADLGPPATPFAALGRRSGVG